MSSAVTESRKASTRFLPFSRTDFIFVVLILLFGGSAVLFHQRTSDFWGDDVFYADAAQSLLHRGIYGVNGNPETTQPPGLAVMLAMLFSVFGYSYPVAVGAMAVCETLGFLLVYALLRRRVSTGVAGAICILLLSSSLYFTFATRMVYACFPYFLSTMLALLSAEEYDEASTLRSNIFWGTVFAAALVASLLIATGTVALLVALAAFLAATMLKDQRLARKRLVKFLPVLLLGILVQGLWILQKPAPLEWNLPGYPASYLEQLKVKNGNYPELGMAKWSDIPIRVNTNLRDESNIVLQFVVHHGVQRARALILIPVVLAAIGWCSSVVRSRGTDLVDWYFAGYQFIYLLWPWTMDARFLFPIAPLFCLYIWQGGRALFTASKLKPRTTGIIGLALLIALIISDVHRWYAQAAQNGNDWLGGLSIFVWVLSAGCAVWMIYTARSVFPEMSYDGERWRDRSLSQPALRPGRLLAYSCYITLTALVAIGTVAEARVIRQNLRATEFIKHPELTGYETLITEVEAGVWLRSNTPQNAVIMARHWPTVHHYAHRKLIWFAPISNPDTLFEGITRHHVDYVVVIRHRHPFYLPDDDYCFDRLLQAYPTRFLLILQRIDLRIFMVRK